MNMEDVLMAHSHVSSEDEIDRVVGKRKAEALPTNETSKRPRIVSSHQIERLPKHEVDVLNEHFDRVEKETVHDHSITSHECERRFLPQTIPRRVSDIDSELPRNALSSIWEREIQSESSSHASDPKVEQLDSEVSMEIASLWEPLGNNEKEPPASRLNQTTMKSSNDNKRKTKPRSCLPLGFIALATWRLFVCFLTAFCFTRCLLGNKADSCRLYIDEGILMRTFFLLQVYQAISIVFQKQNVQSTRLLIPRPEHAKPHLVFPGGGLFFFWQAGVCAYMRENGYDLSQVSLSGASAGAIVALLAITDVDFDKATENAIALVDDWKNPMGLQGKWSSKLRGWLDKLIPKDAHKIAMMNELTIVVTQMPYVEKILVKNFSNREDLMESILTTVHVPWFMDGLFTRNFRGKKCVDGFLPPFYSPLQSTRTPDTTPHILIDWRIDPCYRYCTPIDMIKLLSPESIWGLLEQGKAYAQKREAEGLFLSIPRVGDSQHGAVV